MKDFTNHQNEVFKNLFGALKKRGAASTTQANALIEFDDENFIRLYTDPDNEVVGTEEELKLVEERAKYLEIK